MLRLAGWVRARRGGWPALRRRAGGAAGGQGRGSRRGSGGATWRGAPPERARTGWAELACAHSGRGGAPRHARSQQPGRARLRPSPRRPAGAPPRAPAAKPSSPARSQPRRPLGHQGPYFHYSGDSEWWFSCNCLGDSYSLSVASLYVDLGVLAMLAATTPMFSGGVMTNGHVLRLVRSTALRYVDVDMLLVVPLKNIEVSSPGRWCAIQKY